MTEEEHQQEDEGQLSFVALTDDKLDILLNNEPNYAVLLPRSIHRKNVREKAENYRVLDFRCL